LYEEGGQSEASQHCRETAGESDVDAAATPTSPPSAKHPKLVKRFLFVETAVLITSATPCRYSLPTVERYLNAQTTSLKFQMVEIMRVNDIFGVCVYGDSFSSIGLTIRGLIHTAFPGVGVFGGSYMS